MPQVAVAGEGPCWVASGEKEQTGSSLFITPLHKHKLLLGISFTLAQSRNQVATNAAMARVSSCEPVPYAICRHVYIHALNGVSSFCLRKAPRCEPSAGGQRNPNCPRASGQETAHLLVHRLLPCDVGLLGWQRRVLAWKGGHEILWEVRWSPTLSNL